MELVHACRQIRKNRRLVLRGVQGHIATQITQPRLYQKLVGRLIETTQLIQKRFDIRVDYVDVGGGLPDSTLINIKTGRAPTGEGEFVRAIVSEMLSASFLRDETELILELGRAIVNPCVQLVTQVVAVKEGSLRDNRWLIVDAGLNVLPELEYYTHPIVWPSRRGAKTVTNLGGPLCMNEDVLARGLRLSPLKCGDHLIICNVGAYNLSLSWQFITPRPAVCMIEDSAVKLVRRGETYKDLTHLDCTN
jgi:diaminopimelate decarboxylase